MSDAGQPVVSVVTELVDDPSTPREILVDQIALEIGTGSTIARAARKFGYTYGGMSALCQRPDFQQRVTYYSKRVEEMKHVANRKILLHLDPLLTHELAVALSGEDPVTGIISIDQAAKPAVQKARQYLIDKVMPTTTRVEATTEQVNSPETREVLTSLRDILQRVQAERTQNFSILDSPHVLEGVAALPSPLLQGEVVAKSEEPVDE